MVLIHPYLLFGLALVAVPLILHLLMRAKPKKLVFPALRLIQNRRRTNVRRMRLRHFWLLLLRMAVIALLVLALARPSVPATDYSPSGGDWLRLSALAAALAAAYFGVLGLWRRRKVAPHELAYRRSFLRAGLAAAGLAAFLLVVAWPYQRRIAAAITQPAATPSEFVPATAVMLFDVSLSMEYRYESKTRLEVAQEIASAHIGALPRQSRVAVTDTSEIAEPRFQSDMSGVLKRIAALELRAITRPIEDRLLAAVEAHRDDEERLSESRPEGAADSALREVYVFTDLAGSAWRRDESPRLRGALEQMPGLNVYLIDVGITSPANLAVTRLTLSDETAPMGNEITLRATLEAAGSEGGEKTVELHVENEAGRFIKREQQAVSIDPAAAATASFSLRAQTGPVLQGEIRLASSDPLGFDDVRAFTVQVEPPSEVLVVADEPDDARYIVDALAPPDFVALGRARFRCKTVPPAALTSEPLAKYAAVCLLNVERLGEATWNRLEDYVRQGGGLAIALGDRVDHAAWLTDAARRVLPAELAAERSFSPSETLDIGNAVLSHPVFRKFSEWGTGGLTSVAVRKYWRVTPTRDTAVVATYTDDRQSPAFVERAIGQGRVLLLTTSLDYRWNDLPVNWSFLALADQMMRYLSFASHGVYNYTAGQDVTIPLPSGTRIPAYLLRKPGLQQLRGEVPHDASMLVIRDADQLGSYRISAAEADVKFERGFSMGAPAGESDLRRLSAEDLDARLGKERYSVARDIEGLQRNVRAGRLGREAFPLLALLLLALFVGEHFVANRFYDAEQRPEPPPAT